MGKELDLNMEQCNFQTSMGRCLQSTEDHGYCQTHLHMDGRLNPISTPKTSQGLSGLSTAQRLRADERQERQELISILSSATDYPVHHFSDLSLQDLRNMSEPFLHT